MNPKLKIALCTLLAILAAAGVVWANVARLNSPVKNIEVQIDYPSSDTLVTSQEVAQLVQDQMPHLMTQLVKEVDENRILGVLETSPYLIESDVSVSVGRSIIVRTHQRKPVARVFAGSAQYLIDTAGHHMPVSQHSEPDLVIANGFIKGSEEASENVRIMAQYLDTHPDYARLFDQIYIDPKHDISLVPKLGSHIILIGPAENLDIKFDNLMAFYKKGMQKTGWDTYSVISLKYDGQVICKKRK